MDEPIFRLATREDEAELRRLSALPMPGGWVDLRYQREPNFLDGLNHSGDEVLVGRFADGPIVAMAVRSHRSVYLNGEATDVAYLSTLRVDPGQQGRFMLWKGFRLLGELQEQRPVAEHMATIIDGNQLAKALLVDKSRPSWPTFQRYGQLCTLAMPVGKRYRMHELDNEPRLLQVEEFLALHGPQRQFFPTNPIELGWEKRTWIAHDGGILALRDLSAYHQTIVHGYRPPLNWMRPIYNLWALALGKPPLPGRGKSLEGVYLGFLCARSPEVLRRLLEGALEEARTRKKKWLYLGLMEGDPHLPVAARYAQHIYRSTLYRVFFNSQKGVALDDRPGYLELASL